MGRTEGAIGFGRRFGVLCALAVALLMISVAPAFASMTFINKKPAPGAVVTALPVNVEVDADDSQYSFDINNPNSVIFLNGSDVWAGKKLLGHWIGDFYLGYQYIIDDPTILQLFDPQYELLDGEYTVVARAQNLAGETAEDTWSFTLAVPPKAQSLDPATNTPYQMPKISAILSDNGGGIASVNMRLDGALVPATFDPATRKVSYTPTTPLSDNAAHTVALEMTDTNGNSGTQSWTFNVKTTALATFTNQVPAPGSTVYVADPTLTYTVYSINPKMSDGYGLWVNDRWCFPYAPGDLYTANVSHRGTVFPDGPNFVRATARDQLGFYSEGLWTFNVVYPPTLTKFKPADGGTVGGSRPVIGMRATDNTPDDLLHVRMRVDGVQIFDEVVPQGIVETTPDLEMVEGKTYTVDADVTDESGNVKTATWTFTASAGQAMATSCEQCHVHETTQCYSCHTEDFHTYPFTCSPCHEGEGHDYDTVAGQCGECHDPGATRPAVPVATTHDEAATQVAHVTTTTGCFAAGCHLTSLIDEHGRRPSASTFKYQCTVCHLSTATDVQAAVTGGSTACAACHAGDGHPHDPATVGDTPIGDQFCSTCHSMDLVEEHSKATSSSQADPCGTCHAEGGPRDTIGTWDGTCSQPACHGASTARAVHENFCYACHDEEQGTQFVTTASVEFEEPPVELSRCVACHWKADHFEHGNDRQCNSCHYALPARTQSYTSAVPTAWGWFSSAASILQTPETLHAIHANGSWPAGVTKSPANSQPTDCASCHAAAACEACHGEITPHGPHTKGNPAYPARSYKVAIGRPAGAGPLDTTQTRSVTCAASACHDLTEAASSSTETKAEETAPSFAYTGSWWTTSSSYASGGAMRYASKPGSVLTISFTGPGTLRLYGRKDPYSGKVRISVDGGPTEIVDLYSGSTAWKSLLLDTAPLGEGTHTLRIEPDGTRRAAALGSKVQVDYALVLTKAADKRFKPKCGDCHAERSEVHW